MARKKQQFRHENGFGSIVKLSGKRRKPYAVRITIGWKDGKQLRKYLGYYCSEKDALLALAEYHKNDVDIDLSKLTLNEAYDRWLDGVKNKDVSTSVLRNHNVAKSRFGKLGNTQMSKLKTDHLQKWMDSIELKPRTKGKIRSTMVQLYTYAMNNDIVMKNYAQGIKVNEKVEKVGEIFTQNEIKTLWEHQDNPSARLLLILIYTGMRIGEMLKISRENINFEEGYMIGGSKTEAGRDRVIPIHNRILPLIVEQLGNNKWLVQSNRGVAMSYRNASDYINRLLVELKMEHKIHDTRKTCVSLLHSADIPMETIRVIVGHSGKGVTEKIYLYKQPSELVDIINTMEIPY